MRFFPGSWQPADFFCSPTGTRIQLTYEPRFDGVRTTLVVSGQFDRQERIESFAPYCDLNYMLSRLSVGDSSVLCTRKPVYGDFSGLPDNPIDAINILRSAEQRFASLSAEDKLAHGNDYLRWLYACLSGSAGSGDSAGAAGAAPDSVKEVNKDES